MCVLSIVVVISAVLVRREHCSTAGTRRFFCQLWHSRTLSAVN